MSTAIVVALISGAVSLAAATISLLSARSIATLNHQFDEQQRARTKEEQSAELRARYRDPLMSAAFDLQSRLFNIVAKRFLAHYCSDEDETSRTYAVDNTLYVLAEYLGWVEILRREIRFLDLGDEPSNRQWVTTLERVRDTLARDDIDSALRVFRGDQRAIGQVMTVGEDGEPRQCRGYASFVVERKQPDFARWFERLEADLHVLAREPGRHLDRAVLLQHALVDLLDLLDPECARFGAERRSRLNAQVS